MASPKKAPPKSAPEPSSAAQLWRLAAAVLAYKLCVLLLADASVHMLKGMFSATNYNQNFHWPANAEISLANIYKTWDAQHYLQIAAEGYRSGSMSNNFYPLWPMLIRAVSPLFGGDGLVCALVLSNLFSLGGVVLFYSLVVERRDEATADAAVLLLLAFPGALFFSFPYSESLFFLLAAALFYFLQRGKHGAAAAAAFLLPLSRPQGALAALAFWYALADARRRSGTWRPWDRVYALAPAAGVAAYLLFMRAATGDALAGFSAYREHYAGAPSLMKLLDVAGFLRSFANAASVHGYADSAIDRSWFVLWAASLIPLWRKDRLLFAYALPMGLVPAMTLGFVGYTRQFVLVFPMFALWGGLLSGSGRKWFLAVCLGALTSLQAIFLFMHINNYWVG
jgi:hypothetical protein